MPEGKKAKLRIGWLLRFWFQFDPKCKWIRMTQVHQLAVSKHLSFWRCSMTRRKGASSSEMQFSRHEMQRFITFCLKSMKLDRIQRGLTGVRFRAFGWHSDLDPQSFLDDYSHFLSEITCCERQEFDWMNKFWCGCQWFGFGFLCSVQASTAMGKFENEKANYGLSKHHLLDGVPCCLKSHQRLHSTCSRSPAKSAVWILVVFLP